MRALLAAGLALFLALSAGLPHVHVGPQGADGCVACVVRNGDQARDETPDVAPTGILVSAAAPLEPESAPTSGAPLGAIPGQSPPASA